MNPHGLAKGLLRVAILCLLILVVLGGISAYNNRYSSLKMKWPFRNYAQIKYPQKGLEFFLDPRDKLFGYSHEVVVSDQSTPTGVGVDFNSKIANVVERFGPPVGTVATSEGLTLYGYWSQVGNQVVMDKGYLVFQFHRGRLTKVTAMFREFRLLDNITYRSTRSDVIGRYGKPNEAITRSDVPIVLPSVKPIPIVLPIAMWFVTGLLAATSWLLAMRSRYIRETSIIRLIAAIVIGVLYTYIGFVSTAAITAGLSVMWSAGLAILSLAVGTGVGIFYALFFRLIKATQNRNIKMLYALAFIISSAIWIGLLLVSTSSRLYSNSSGIVVIYLLMFPIAWIIWTLLMTIEIAESNALSSPESA